METTKVSLEVRRCIICQKLCRYTTIDGRCEDCTDVIIFNKNEPPEIPKEVATCRVCGGQLVIEDIDTWFVNGDLGRVTESGLHINCETEPYIDSEDWSSWHHGHWSMPYVDWLPVQRFVYKWFDRRYRMRLEQAPTPANEAE